MLLWTLFFAAGLVAILFLSMYPRPDYNYVVEQPIAAVPIVQFVEQHKTALELANKAVESAIYRECTGGATTCIGNSPSLNDNLTINYPSGTFWDGTSYLPDSFNQSDWDTDITTRVVCLNYSASQSVGTCSLGGYNAQTATFESGTRDYLITYANKPANLDTEFPMWGAAWDEAVKNVDTCGIVKKNANTVSVQFGTGITQLTGSNYFKGLIENSGLTVNDGGFICISPIDHYAYDGISITEKNQEMVAFYDGIVNTWTGHKADSTTWVDLSGNGNNGTITYLIKQSDPIFQPSYLNVFDSYQKAASGNVHTASGSILLTPIHTLFPQQTIQTVLQLDFEKRRNTNNGAGVCLWGSRTGLAEASNSGFELWLYSNFSVFYESAGASFKKATLTFSKSYLDLPSTLTFKRDMNSYTLYSNLKKLGKTTGFSPLEMESTSNKFGFMSPRNNYGAPTHLYGMRIYDIPLSGKEIDRNYRLDRKRYNLPKTTNNSGSAYYLQTTGTQWLKTDYPLNSTSSVTMVFCPTTLGRTYKLFGNRENLYQNAFNAFILTAGTIRFDYSGTTANQVQSSKLTKNVCYTIKKEKQNNYLDDTAQTANAEVTFSGDRNAYVLNINSVEDYVSAIGQLKGFTMSDNDTIQHNFVPAEDPFGYPAMYDTVTKKFFYNQGSGTFSIGIN